MENFTRAFKPSLTMYDYEAEDGHSDMWGRDPVEVERRIVAYHSLFLDSRDEDSSEQDDVDLTRALELDWVGTVRQLREEGLESVLSHVRMGNHLESPF